MSPVFLDADVIIEASRTKILAGLLNRYSIYTVKEVVKECNLPPKHQRKSGFIKVNLKLLAAKANILKVNNIQKARLAVLTETGDLHAGERDLLAAILNWEGDFRLCLADYAAIRIALSLNHKNNLIALEKLAKNMGLSKQFKNQFTIKQLSINITKLSIDRMRI